MQTIQCNAKPIATQHEKADVGNPSVISGKRREYFQDFPVFPTPLVVKKSKE